MLYHTYYDIKYLVLGQKIRPTPYYLYSDLSHCLWDNSDLINEFFLSNISNYLLGHSEAYFRKYFDSKDVDQQARILFEVMKRLDTMDLSGYPNIRERIQKTFEQNIINEAIRLHSDSNHQIDLSEILAAKIKQKILAQDYAVDTVCRAPFRSLRGNQPIGVYFFFGPTGVGKTELSKLLAKYHFNNRICILPMNQYTNGKLAGTTFLGPPPEYQNFGSAQGGKMRREVKPKLQNSEEELEGVLVFDEVEKAAPEFIRFLLTLIDEGTITDNAGQMYILRKCIIIFTSNLFSGQITEKFLNGENEQEVREFILRKCAETDIPEFYGRGEILTFRPLSSDSIRTILINLFNENAKEIRVSHKLSDNFSFNVDQSVIEHLCTIANPAMGARNIQKLHQREIADRFNTLLLSTNEKLKRINILMDHGIKIGIEIETPFYIKHISLL